MTNRPDGTLYVGTTSIFLDEFGSIVRELPTGSRSATA